jgi:hypothetical protein
MRYLPGLALLVCVAAIAGGGGASARPPVATAAATTTYTLQPAIGVKPATQVTWTVDAPGGKATWDHCCEAGKWSSEFSFTPPPTLTTGGTGTFNLGIKVTDCESGSGCNFQMAISGPGVAADRAATVHADFKGTANVNKSVMVSLPDSWASQDTAIIVLTIDSGPELTYTYKRDAAPAPAAAVVVPPPAAFGQTVTAPAPPPGGTAGITSPKLPPKGGVNVDVTGVSPEDVAVIAEGARKECYVNFTRAAVNHLLKANDVTIDKEFDLEVNLGLRILTEKLATCVRYVNAAEAILSGKARAVASASPGCAVPSVKLSLSGSGANARLRSTSLRRAGDKRQDLKVSCKLTAGRLTMSVAPRSAHKSLRSIVGSRLRIGIVRSPKDSPGGQLSVAFQRR